MNVSLQSQYLSKELELLSRVVAKKPTIPILGNVLIQADGEGLRLAATDLEVGIITFCHAMVAEPGAVTLPVQHLGNIIKLLPADAEVTLETVPGKTGVRLKSGRYVSQLQTYKAEDFPVMPGMRDLPQMMLPSAPFKDMIRKVRFAVSAKTKTFTLDGALLTFTPDGMMLVATDTKRLSLARAVCTPVECEPVLIPSGALDHVASLPGDDADILFAYSDRHLFFVTDGRMLFSRRMEGKFPNYQRIIPQNNHNSVSIPRVQLREAVERVVLTTSELSLQLTGEALLISARSVDIGDTIDSVEVPWTGAAVTFLLDGALLLDFLHESTGEAIVLTWKTAAEALMFMDGEDYRYIQMPLRK